MELVRISTAGNVDDGKSTLIGRLLYDNNALTEEQEALIEQKSKEKGWNDLDFSVLTDGLTAEREQGITIDVAHIYFSTKSHKFIITDSPGHVEYTRNMVTGASTSNLSIILIDARKGLQEQSYRHYYISQLLRLERVIFCVNKMDLVEYSEDRFLEIAIDVQRMVKAFGHGLRYDIVPISSLKGDNVVYTSTHMPWYTGDTLNTLLHVRKEEKDENLPFRFDVQQVFHSQEEGFTDYRGYAGRVLSGSVSLGDQITVLPSGKQVSVTEIRRYTEALPNAQAGDSVALSLSTELDISRGALFSDSLQFPSDRQQFSCTLVWMDDKQAQAGQRYLLKTGARDILVKIQQIVRVIDPIHPGEVLEKSELALNDIAEVELRSSQSTYLDAYEINPRNGAFILIDEQSNQTVAVGMTR